MNGMTVRREAAGAARQQGWRRSLTFKLIVAFLLTSILGVGLAALLARVITTREFDRFVLGELRNQFVADAEAYYQEQGSWAGAGEYFRQREAPQEPGAAPRPPQFLLADQNGIAVTPAQPFRPGEPIPDDELARGVPVEVWGRPVGTVIDRARAPELGPREVQYLNTTSQAIALGALGAALIALLVGVILARTLTRPLRDLIGAIQAMAAGELKQEVPVRSADELGTLTVAFNQLSADLAHSNELRRQMTADIAHDLRTPLSVINAYIDGLRDGVFKPTPARLDAMHVEAQHLQHLVEDLRTLSLADAGELPIQRIPVAPRPLLERLAAAYAPQADASGVVLQVIAEPDLPDILADPERIIQVLGNLVTNALRYTPSGGQITLSGCRHADGAVALAVQDTGYGIAPEALPHVFDRFYRGDRARNQQDNESGLGLAIARSIVTAHGGQIDVQSELECGTAFTVLMPVAL
jgi:signal transduction histidine kinase